MRPDSSELEAVVELWSRSSLEGIESLAHSVHVAEIPPDLRGSVGDPALVVRYSPVGIEVVDGLVEVVGGCVDRGAFACSGECYVGELTSAAGGEDVGPVVGCSLGAVNRDGVGVVEVLGVEGLAEEDDVAAVVDWLRRGSGVVGSLRR